MSFGFEAILHKVASQWTTIKGPADEVITNHGIVCVDVHPATLKKWATNNGRALKPDMIQAATRLTGVPLTEKQDNEADALCLLVYGAADAGEVTP